MSHYRVLLRGQNFWITIDGRSRRMGFHTTRFVEEASPEAAELAAVDRLRVEGRLKPLNDPSDPPLVFTDEIEEVYGADVPSVTPGFAFFPDDAVADA